jgi:hypothetical protein
MVSGNNCQALITASFIRCKEACIASTDGQPLLDVGSVESVEVPPVLSAHVGVDGGLVQLSENVPILKTMQTHCTLPLESIAKRYRKSSILGSA